MAKSIRGHAASAAFVERDKDGRPIAMFVIGVPPAPYKPAPRFDGGDGGDECDADSAPIMWLRQLVERHPEVPLSMLGGFRGYHLSFSSYQSEIQARRIPEREHDPGDEDPWLVIRHEELMAAICAAGT